MPDIIRYTKYMTALQNMIKEICHVTSDCGMVLVREQAPPSSRQLLIWLPEVGWASSGLKIIII